MDLRIVGRRACWAPSAVDAPATTASHTTPSTAFCNLRARRHPNFSCCGHSESRVRLHAPAPRLWRSQSLNSTRSQSLGARQSSGPFESARLVKWGFDPLEFVDHVVDYFPSSDVRAAHAVYRSRPRAGPTADPPSRLVAPPRIRFLCPAKGSHEY